MPKNFHNKERFMGYRLRGETKTEFAVIRSRKFFTKQYSCFLNTIMCLTNISFKVDLNVVEALSKLFEMNTMTIIRKVVTERLPKITKNSIQLMFLKFFSNE